ncbi:docking protein 3-like isoform X1 [Oreochromis aureus]|uniref:docking protein 3-like isoform X1 n=2 Tax=Oreochromis aureus TaxID=47969 RepID=UPI0012BC3069|nr:docking protein 3-like isoform X1 [Oreochromis aureus]
MDAQTKSGKVYLQPHKPGKKWKPVWLSLTPPSSSGVGRLEIQDMGGGDLATGVRKHGDRRVKVVRLSELISVLRLPPNAEACPMENMWAFCVETQDRTMVFAALRDDCADWVDKLCQSTFQKGGRPRLNQPQMEENQIYVSVEEASEFWVAIQRTEAATRCGLQGAYWLQVGREALLLKETQKKNVVHEWPYELLRRYGNDKLTLTIEAGRRCDSGPGVFIFETPQAEKIFTLIQSTIKLKTSSTNQNPEGEKVVVTNIQAHSPLPKVPDMTNIAAILENKLRTEESKEESAHAREDQPPPITLMPLPLVPMSDGSSAGNHGDQSEAIYANPSDCIRPVMKTPPVRSTYIDPASVLPLKPPCAAPHPPPRADDPDSVYSEVYDKISPHQNKDNVLQKKEEMKVSAEGDPVYAQPSSRSKVSLKSEAKADPFAHLYAHVCKKAPSSSPSSSNESTPSSSSSPIANTSTTKATDCSLDDVIYENLGII